MARAIQHRLVAALLAIALAGCGGKHAGAPSSDQADTAKPELLLPTAKGDWWRYVVEVEEKGLPSRKSVRVRRCIGTRAAADGDGELHVFEVTSPGMPQALEFLKITPDEVRLMGTETLDGLGAGAHWLGGGVPLCLREMNGGQVLRVPIAGGETMTLSVVGRESIDTPAGKCEAYRLTLEGRRGAHELRRLLWFSPGNGVIREESNQYVDGQRVSREVVTLAATSRTLRGE